MEGHQVFALVFIAIVVFGPLMLGFLEYGLDPIAEKLVKHIDKRIEKEDRDV